MTTSPPKYTAAHWGSYRFDGTGLAPVADDPHPSAVGQSWWSAARHEPTRIARPAFRRGWLQARDSARSGDAEFVELPWDEALDIVAGEFRRIIDSHGNSAIFGGSYGWASAGRFHHAQSQLSRFLNCIGGYTAKRNSYSHAGAEVLFPHVFGLSFYEAMGQATSWPSIEAEAELILAFGGLADRTAQIASGGVARHHVAGRVARLRDKGIQLVNVSPQQGDLDGGTWLPIRPGTDRALILALAYVLFDEGLADEAFLSRYTSGAEIWRAQVMGERDGQPKTPDWAAPICDLMPDVICALARDLAANKSLITCAYGLQRADRGEETLWAAINLACMLGRIGQPGTGFAFGPASMNSSNRPVRTRSWPAVPAGKNPVADFIPVARIADMLDAPGALFHYNGGTHIYPDIRMIAWAGGNPFHHHQDLFRLERAWQRPDTVLILDHSWTATARRADIVLPATSPLEREDIMLMYRESEAVYMSRLRPPHGEARDDHAILAGLADRLGVGPAFTEGRDTEGWLRHLWDQARTKAPGLPDFEALKAAGRVNVPDSDVASVFLEAFIADPDAAPLATPSGKIEVASRRIADMALPDLGATPSWTAPREWTGDAPADALHLISPQPQMRLHAQNDAGDASRAAKVQGRERCYLHPDTAAAHDLAEGDVALLRNARGRTLAGVTLTPGIRRDCIALPTGAWMDVVLLEDGPIDVHGNPNVLTYDAGSSALSQGNPAHTALVYVSKWDRPLPPVTVFDGPRLVRGG